MLSMSSSMGATFRTFGTVSRRILPRQQLPAPTNVPGCPIARARRSRCARLITVSYPFHTGRNPIGQSRGPAHRRGETSCGQRAAPPDRSGGAGRFARAEKLPDPSINYFFTFNIKYLARFSFLTNDKCPVKLHHPGGHSYRHYTSINILSYCAIERISVCLNQI